MPRTQPTRAGRTGGGTSGGGRSFGKPQVGGEVLDLRLQAARVRKPEAKRAGEGTAYRLARTSAKTPSEQRP